MTTGRAAGSTRGSGVYIGILVAAIGLSAWAIAVSVGDIEETPPSTSPAAATPVTKALSAPAPAPATKARSTEKTVEASKAAGRPAASKPAATAPQQPETRLTAAKAEPVPAAPPASKPKVTVIDLPVRTVESPKPEPVKTAVATPAVRTLASPAPPSSARPLIELITMVPIPGAEIVAFDPWTNIAFVTCNQGVAVVQLWEGRNATVLRTIDLGAALGLGEGAEVTHATIDPAGRGILAATVAPKDRAGVPGRVAFLGTRTGAVMGSVTVGFLPDGAAFSPDGSRLVVVNEGEARPLAAGGLNDPPGSVSVIDLSGVTSAAQFKSLGQDRVFTRYFDGPALASALSDSVQGLRIHPVNRATPSLDLEPESVAIHGSRAYVTLQENNGLAVLNLDTLAWSAIAGLGVIERRLDPSDRDGVHDVRATVAALPMPDQLAVCVIGGRAYVVLAEEGDDRGAFGATSLGDSASLAELAKAGRLAPSTAEKLDLSDAGLGRLHICAFTGETTGNGLIDRPHTLGTRSLGVYDADTLRRVGDTGSRFEELLAERFAAIGRVNEVDSRSDRRGPEPEGLTVVDLDGLPIVFMTLERPGAIAVVSLADPAVPAVLDVIPTAPIDGVGPEGVTFVNATNSPNGRAMLLVGFEASGMLGIFEVNQAVIREAANEFSGRP